MASERMFCADCGSELVWHQLGVWIDFPLTVDRGEVEIHPLRIVSGIMDAQQEGVYCPDCNEFVCYSEQELLTLLSQGKLKTESQRKRNEGG